MMSSLVPDRVGSDPQRRLSRSECLAFLRGRPMGRAAFTTEGMLTVVPTPFAMGRGRITFLSERPTQLDQAVGQVVAFQSDGYDVLAGELWNVCVTGIVVRSPQGELSLEPRLFSGWAEQRDDPGRSDRC